ncbi:MAG: serine hydrolase, partial [Bacteroidota bacterium]
ELQLDFEPGSQWQYSGEGYVLLSKVMEQVMAKSFEDLTEAWVFEPLGMTNSSFVWKDNFAPDVAVGHNMIHQPDELEQLTEPNAAASLLTTAGDYAKLMRAIRDSKFLSAQSRKYLIEEYIDATVWGAEDVNEYIAWGLGVGLQKGDGDLGVWQWGDNYLFRGMMIYFPEDDKGLVYLTNSENGLSMAKVLYSYFFDGPAYAIDWLGYEAFDNPERSAAIDLEMAYVHQSSEEATGVYERILRQDSSLLKDNLINNTVWSLFGSKQLDEAVGLIERHLENFPNSAETWVRKGEALAFAHDYTGSWQAYQQAMDLDAETSRVIMPRFPWYQEAWSALQAQEDPSEPSAYVGQYGAVTISQEGTRLMYSDGERENIPLYRLSNDVFDLESLETFRLRFDWQGDIAVGLTKSHLTGDEDYLAKVGV